MKKGLRPLALRSFFCTSRIRLHNQVDNLWSIYHDRSIEGHIPLLGRLFSKCLNLTKSLFCFFIVCVFPRQYKWHNMFADGTDSRIFVLVPTAVFLRYLTGFIRLTQNCVKISKFPEYVAFHVCPSFDKISGNVRLLEIRSVSKVGVTLPEILLESWTDTK